MLFNSLTFSIFFLIVFFLYWFALKERLKLQNLFLLLASYVFYGWWDWRFLSLIILSSFLDYFLGLNIHQSEDSVKRKRLLYVSLFVNLGMLGVFKYFNFFSESFSDLLGLVGLHADPFTLNFILPVGISFYTFQTLSYTIDIYKKQLKPTNDIVQFFAFVSFFPQLVAGPIERARHLLPQFAVQRVFNYDKAVNGLRQILWGFFKKVVIADNCAPIVNTIFDNYETQPGSMLILGVVLFAFQIYGDFSGYSDIAIGTAKLLGFNLSKNFDFPYFSTSMAEMWRRWHMSLSTWTGEYIFLPISKNRKTWGRKGVVYALMCTFLILGIWHGANWTFVVFGLLHGSIVAFEYFFKKQLKQKDRFLKNKTLINLTGWATTILFWLLGMLFFRATNVGQGFAYLGNIFSNQFLPESMSIFLIYRFIFFFIPFLMLIEWFQRKRDFGLAIGHWKLAPLRWGLYYGLILIMLRYAGGQQSFIYFQF